MPLQQRFAFSGARGFLQAACHNHALFQAPVSIPRDYSSGPVCSADRFTTCPASSTSLTRILFWFGEGQPLLVNW